MKEFERIINDTMQVCANYNNFDYENGMELEELDWDPIMGEVDDYPETDDEWLDDFQGEEEFA